MSLELRGLRKTFTQDGRGQLVVLDDIDLTVETGEFCTIMGPSGCGKSTLLNILAGIVPMDAGEIVYESHTREPGDLPVGYVFQESRLLPWRTVEANIAFALKARGIPKEEHDRRITDSLEMVGLADERQSYPLRLSGGMRQRVGIARALSVDPDILLMDEPFSSLDELTARNLRNDLIELWQETGKTIVFVTHDISEAVLLSDRITFLDTAGTIFNRATVPNERPRRHDDPALLETEAGLMERFFEHMESLSAEVA